jgi:hypothetical protein
MVDNIANINNTNHSSDKPQTATAYRTTFRLLRTKITIDLLFPCKQIIWPRFYRMQLTLLVTGKNE